MPVGNFRDHTGHLVSANAAARLAIAASMRDREISPTAAANAFDLGTPQARLCALNTRARRCLNELAEAHFIAHFVARKNHRKYKYLKELVGVAGFEPATPASRTQLSRHIVLKSLAFWLRTIACISVRSWRSRGYPGVGTPYGKLVFDQRFLTWLRGTSNIRFLRLVESPVPKLAA